MLRIEELEPRDNGSVTIYHFVVAPSPQGDPGFQGMAIQGDPTHSPRPQIVLPHGGPNHIIFVNP